MLTSLKYALCLSLLPFPVEYGMHYSIWNRLFEMGVVMFTFNYCF